MRNENFHGIIKDIMEILIVFGGNGAHMKKRIWSTALALCLLLSAAPVTVRAESEVVEIADSAGLAAIAEDLSGHYKLTADIELTEAWTPPAVPTGPGGPYFTGTLDGGGHTISNLFMAEDVEFASLIGDIDEGAEIRDLRVVLAAQGVSSTFDAGGLVNYMGGGRIENCSVSGEVRNTEPEDCWAGALVAYLADGTVSGCVSTGSVSGGGAGGLIGFIEGGTVENSYSLAEVSGTYSAGGLAASAENAALACCYAAGAVSVTNDPGDLGGFLGVREDNADLTSCFFRYEDAIDRTPNGVGTDHNYFGTGEAAGLSEEALTAGAPPAADWDTDVWYFSTGAYPQLQWERGQTDEPVPPAQVTNAQYSETEEFALYRITFPAVNGAVAYQVMFYDASPAPEARGLAARAAAEPLYTGLFTPILPGDTVDLPLGDMLTEAARADVALHPQKTAFTYSVTVAAVGSGNAVGAPSSALSLPEMQRLTAVQAPDTIVCERGDSLTKPASLSGTVQTGEIDLSIRWTPPYSMPRQANFAGRRTYEAPLVLPLHVLNPDGFMAVQTVEAYQTFAPPQNPVWDSAILGRAVWELPDDPGGSVLVCLLDRNRNPVGGEKTIPRLVEQSYDFNKTFRQLGSGDYFFRVRTNASADGYSRASAWVTSAEAFHYIAPTSGGGSSTTYYILTATAGTGGRIAPEGSVRVARGGGKPFTVTPDTGYLIGDVLVDGESVGAVDRYSFENVAGNHTIEARFQKEGERPQWNPFEDVREGDWFHDDVRYVYEDGLMRGVSATRFSPGWDTSRGMIVTILWRLEQEPESGAAMPFADVGAGSACYDAVRWAASQKIVKGYDAATFGPDNAITRQELAAILYRYTQYKGRDVSASDDLAGFIDRPDPWAEENVRWAVGSGLLEGKGHGVLDPRGRATRAETAAMLTRLLRGKQA